MVSDNAGVGRGRVTAFNICARKWRSSVGVEAKVGSVSIDYCINRSNILVPDHVSAMDLANPSLHVNGPARGYSTMVVR